MSNEYSLEFEENGHLFRVAAREGPKDGPDDILVTVDGGPAERWFSVEGVVTPFEIRSRMRVEARRRGLIGLGGKRRIAVDGTEVLFWLEGGIGHRSQVDGVPADPPAPPGPRVLVAAEAESPVRSQVLERPARKQPVSAYEEDELIEAWQNR